MIDGLSFLLPYVCNITLRNYETDDAQHIFKAFYSDGVMSD